jgi:hypothetical protein
MNKLLLLFLIPSAAFAMNDNNSEAPAALAMSDNDSSFISKETHKQCCRVCCTAVCLVPSAFITKCCWLDRWKANYACCEDATGCDFYERYRHRKEALPIMALIVAPPVIGNMLVGPMLGEQTHKADQKLKSLVDRLRGKEKSE